MRMYDSITVSNLPAGAPAYLGYPNGLWPTLNALKARFPGAHILSLTVFPGYAADGCDCEAGDLTIAQAAAFVLWRIQEGQYRPAAYAGAANGKALLAAISALGVGRSQFRYLSAHYGAGKHICGPSTCGYPQADGTQWTDRAPGANGSLVDESLLSPDFFDGPPKPPLPHVAMTGDEMPFTLPNGTGAVVAYPVPRAVATTAGGAPVLAVPVELRFSSNAPAQLEYMLGDSGIWVPLNIDYNRSPDAVNLKGAAVVKVKRVDKGTNLVTGDFA